MKTIKDMPEHTRPREKLREKGASAVSDEELVAAILGMGTAGVDVRTLSKQVAGLIREHKEALTLDHLVEVSGMGLAKAGQILAAFELARRHLGKGATKISCATDVLPFLNDIAGKQQEYFVCISLNGANEVIEKRIVTVGLLDRSPVHPRECRCDCGSCGWSDLCAQSPHGRSSTERVRFAAAGPIDGSRKNPGNLGFRSHHCQPKRVLQLSGIRLYPRLAQAV